MAVIEDPRKRAVAVKLNNGVKSGVVQTVSVGLGSLDVQEWDSQKAMNIVNALEPCFSKDVYSVQKTLVSNLYNE